jgi:hypothetical protein
MKRIGLIVLLLLSFASASAASVRVRGVAAAAPTGLRYSFPVGDVLVYSRVFDTENRPVGSPEAVYSIHEEWLIEAAVVQRTGGTAGLAVQSTRTAFKVTGRRALERAVGGDDTDNLLAPFERAETRSVRYLLIDEMGRSLNRSYSIQDAASFVVASMKEIFSLPSQPIWEGWSVVTEGATPLEVIYEGLQGANADVRHVFRGRHPSGEVRLEIDGGLAIPSRFEYAAEYEAAGERRCERNTVVFRGLKKDGWANWGTDPYVDRALVLGAIARSGLSCPRGIIKAFLDDGDEQKQNLAAAYCALRGIPDGLNMRGYLEARNPLVRFDAAKALFKFAADARPLIAKMRDSESFVRRRAAAFFSRSTDILPADRRPMFWALQNWMYEGGDLPDEFRADEGELHDLLRFLKPPNEAVGGCYREFLPGSGPDDQHPYYLSLPVDYDPAETFPMIVYLGMGDGRGDYAFQSVYNGLRAAGALSRFILLVPQAHGKWWDESVEPVVNRVLAAALKSLSIDTNQVYLAGSSNGGMGTIYFGTRLPDRFAALGANMGYPVVDRRFLEEPQNLDILQNLNNAKVFLSHGAADRRVTPEGDRTAADILRKADGQVVLREMVGKKHNIDIREVIGGMLDVFESERRNPYPRRIDFVMSDPAYARCFWVEIESASAPTPQVHAVVRGNTIEVRTDGVARLRIYLDEGLVDLSKEVVALVNGREAFRGLVRPSTADLLLSLKKTEDAQEAYGASIEVQTF